MTFLETWIVSLFLFLFSLPARVETAEDVIKRHIDAIGGQAALDTIQTMKYTRELNHLDEGKVSRRIYHQKRPLYYRSCSESSSNCLVVDGEKAWRSRSGETQKKWEEIDYPTREIYILNRLGPFLDFEERRIRVFFVGTEPVDGRELHHLLMTWPDGTKRDLFFDAETGLFVMFKPDEKTSVRVSDYRRIGDVLIPHLLC